MTTPDHPLPAAGGSYTRDPLTGELTPLEAPADDAPEAPAEMPVQTTVKRGAKAPAKED